MITKKVKLLIGLVLLLLLPALYYALSPLFRTVALDEVAPLSAELVSESVPLIDTPTHPASGSVSIVKTGDRTFLRYEDLKTINGPDLYVYLSNDLEATEFVSLGKLRATEGNINYEIPAGTDLSTYKYALVWCEQFGVLFNYAGIELK